MLAWGFQNAKELIDNIMLYFRTMIRYDHPATRWRTTLGFVLALMLTGCAQPVPPPEWQFNMGKPIIPEGKEVVQCNLHVTTSDGTYVELSNHYGILLLTTFRHGTIFGEFLPATITMANRASSLKLPARPINGNVLVASISNVSDPSHLLVSAMTLPFQLTGQVGANVVISESLPAVPVQLGRMHAACLVLDGRIENGTAAVTRDGAGNKVYSTQITQTP